MGAWERCVCVCLCGCVCVRLRGRSEARRAEQPKRSSPRPFSRSRRPRDALGRPLPHRRPPLRPACGCVCVTMWLWCVQSDSQTDRETRQTDGRTSKLLRRGTGMYTCHIKVKSLPPAETRPLSPTRGLASVPWSGDLQRWHGTAYGSPGLPRAALEVTDCCDGVLAFDHLRAEAATRLEQLGRQIDLCRLRYTNANTHTHAHAHTRTHTHAHTHTHSTACNCVRDYMCARARYADAHARL